MVICLVESTGNRLENRGQGNKQGFDDKKKLKRISDAH